MFCSTNPPKISSVFIEKNPHIIGAAQLQPMVAKGNRTLQTDTMHTAEYFTALLHGGVRWADI